MKKPDEIFLDFQNKLNTIPDLRHRVREIVDFSTVYGDCYGAKITPLLEQGIGLAREAGDKVGETLCFCHLGFMTRVTGVKAPTKYSATMPELVKMVDEIKTDREGYTMGLNLVSYFHWFRGEYEKAFNLAFESLKVTGQNQLVGVGWNNFGLAVFYFDTKDFENSKKHYQKALDIFIEIDLEYGRARASNGLGSIAIVENRIDDALPLLRYAASIYRKMGHYAGLSRAENDMGLLEKANGNYDKAVSHLKESIELRKEICHIQGLITSYTELGETYQMMKDHQRALEQLEKGLALAREIKTQQKEMRLHKLLYDTYKVLGNTELALLHFEKFFDVKSQILSDDAANNIKKVQTRYEKEKSEKEAELERFKNVELKKANTIIEQKNKDISDSIHYAERIQRSFLATKEELDAQLKDYFILFQPKDVVSGDFYWSHQLKNGNYALVTADSTGHGVPGAIMSLLNTSSLDKAVELGITEPSEILNHTRKIIIERLTNDGSAEGGKDGMDCSLISLNQDKTKLVYAAANNPVWIVRKAETEALEVAATLIELAPDKIPVGKHDRDSVSFTQHEVDLLPGDMIYTLTDGYADQFGGPKGKKFMYKKLKELLVSISSMPLDQQNLFLKSTLEEWMGNTEQVDDITIIGIRI